MLKTDKLIYTGAGYGGTLLGVPARDLSPKEVEKFGREKLLASGLYRPLVENKNLNPVKENKKISEGVENGRD